ncbi:MAG: bifunctional diaminohydroxyphosphoribosylaminopyrimidine deaminase/5-amino-6-(5-phosphoribosylamino)uracil reductase RibD [Bryobacteraceae bacterium]|nr:bifunctional diaminohydroxyphosphoribosylaminopyrimidine deaminase/5-amino-6-(5-phosphoribosylamino)uracil reductase RibD [Bryobacteraceae bacterium]
MMADFIREALALARQGIGATSPNPAVGAVLVRDGEVVGRGCHTYAGKLHAEILAVEQAGERARGATLYINLEPCCHYGRTPPCADRLIAAGVKRVVAAMEDPNPQVSGEGFRRLREAGVAVEIASEFTSEAEKLNEAFRYFMRHHRPLVTLKAALTLDGKISAPEDNYGWITSETARAQVQEVRHAHDAILTGIGTVLADDCRLTDRTGKPRSRPLLRIVVDSQLRIPLNSKMLATSPEDLVVVTTSAAVPERRAAVEDQGARVLVCDGADGRVDLRGVVDWLASEQYLSLMVEAGSKLNWAFLEAAAVDKILFYYAPKILGGLKSLPVVGGKGRNRRVDAILFRDIAITPIPPVEFMLEAYLVKD